MRPKISNSKKLLKYKNDKSAFDCIIGVSGGKDSTRQALWIRDKLKLRPLLVCYFAYHSEQLTNLGANNLSNLIKLGFDLIVSLHLPFKLGKSS